MVDPFLPRTLSEKVKHRRQKIGLKRRMRVGGKIGRKNALKYVGSVIGKERISLGVSSHIHIEIVIHVQRLAQKWNRTHNDDQYQDRNVCSFGCLVGIHDLIDCLLLKQPWAVGGAESILGAPESISRSSIVQYAPSTVYGPLATFCT